MTVLSLLALGSLGLSAFAFGLLLTVFGITSLVGASIATWFGAPGESPSSALTQIQTTCPTIR
jgi:hypothetical protein